MLSVSFAFMVITPETQRVFLFLNSRNSSQPTCFLLPCLRGSRLPQRFCLLCPYFPTAIIVQGVQRECWQDPMQAVQIGSEGQHLVLLLLRFAIPKRNGHDSHNLSVLPISASVERFFFCTTLGISKRRKPRRLLVERNLSKSYKFASLSKLLVAKIIFFVSFNHGYVSCA